MNLYHGTDDTELEARGFSTTWGSRDDRSVNGQLGTWLAVNPFMAHRFGSVLLEVRLPCIRHTVMTISELANLNRASQHDAEKYQVLREELVSDGYNLIWIEELDGSRSLAVALKPNQLKIQRNLTNAHAMPPL